MDGRCHRRSCLRCTRHTRSHNLRPCSAAHTTFWLVFPSIFGLFFAIRRYAEEGVSKRENTWTAVFGLFMSVWVTLFLEAWKRVQSRRAQEWGMQCAWVSPFPRLVVGCS